MTIKQKIKKMWCDRFHKNKGSVFLRDGDKLKVYCRKCLVLKSVSGTGFFYLSKARQCGKTYERKIIRERGNNG